METFRALKKKDAGFEVVFVSGDRDAAQFKVRFDTQHGRLPFL
jgi:hypothetical protein